jgi:hypothetical protein
LQLDKSSASRRAKVACELGYLINQEDRRSKPAQLVIGDTLPEEAKVLPSPDDLGGVGIPIPSCNSATLQHPTNGRTTEVIDGILVDYDAFSDFLWEGLDRKTAVQRARVEMQPAHG